MRHEARGAGTNTRREGFALLVVVILLFAVGVTAAATYQLIFSETQLAGFNREADRARLVAEAGAVRYIGAHVGGAPLAEEVEYDFGTAGGQAIRQARVSARKVLDDPATWSELWRVRSEGRVVDPRIWEFPALREVSLYGRLRTPPANILGTLITTAGSGSVIITDAAVSATDAAPAGLCPLAPRNAPEPVADGRTLEQIGLPPWSAFFDPGYPVDIEWSEEGGGAAPNFNAAGLPDFPVVRATTASLSVGSSWSGQGVLLVSGNVEFTQQFSWDGIILVGGSVSTSTTPGDNPTVEGLIVSGLTGPGTSVTLERGEYRFHSCNVLAAGRSIGVLNPESAAWLSAF